MLKGTGTLASKSRVAASDNEREYRKKKFDDFFSLLALFQRRKEEWELGKWTLVTEKRVGRSGNG